MITAALASLITGIVSAVASAGVGVANLVSSANENQKNIDAQKEANSENIAMQRETNAMNEQLMRESWARDDTAIQRAKADALSAGFSPLAGLNPAGNSGPITLSAPQTTAVTSKMDRSGFGQLQNALSGIKDIPMMRQQAELTDKQIEGLRLSNQSQKIENSFKVLRTLKELEGLDLNNTKLKQGIMDYYSDLLARNVITESDIPVAFRGVKAHNRYQVEDEFKAESNANQARSNEISAWKEANRHSEWESEFASTTLTKEEEKEVKFSYMGQEVRLKYKQSESGQYLPITSGINPNEKSQGTVGYSQPASVISELNKNIKNDNYKYKFYGWSTDGLPVVKVNIPTLSQPQYLALVPKGKNTSLYKIDPKEVSSGSWDAWTSKYGKDYGELISSLQKAKAFK